MYFHLIKLNSNLVEAITRANVPYFFCFDLFQLQLLGCLAGVEMILKDVGYPVKLGSGVAAACAYLQNNIPMIPSRI